jgi:sarcosine oxidase subunit delta
VGFLLDCPNCGKRDVYEYRFGGEQKKRPASSASKEEWANYVYMRKNVAGVETEWWYHSLGCRRWLVAVRDTRDNSVSKTFWPGEE